MFSNPVTVMVGGVIAVILELAEPHVRHGVWDHSSFRTKPLDRMIRTGKAAMITVYAPRVDAASMIEGVTRMHARVSGTTDAGALYSALDPDLLTWVQATASYGFLQAFARYGPGLSAADMDAGYREAQASAALYGAINAPQSQAQFDALYAATRPSLEPSDTLQDFLRLAQSALPLPGSMASLVINGAVALLPEGLAQQLDITGHALTETGERRLKMLARLSHRAALVPGHPAVDACRRMGIAPSALRKKHAPTGA